MSPRRTTSAAGSAVGSAAARRGGAVFTGGAGTGLEVDATETGKNESLGVTIQNSGGRAVILAGVASWRFLSALGGNFSLNGSYGVPLYEDVNLYGLGTDYVATAMLNFKYRFNY